MAVLGKFTKQPREVETYTVEYSNDLTERDYLVSANGEVAPTGSLVLLSTTFNGSAVRVWVQGGNVGTKYKISIIVHTNDGRVLEDEFYVTIKEY